jgi:hypothetical protein
VTQRLARLIVTVSVLLACTVVLGAAGRPVIRVNVVPQKAVLVGQQVTVTVQILVPNYFLSSPDWPTLEIDGAVVTMPDEVLPHLTETIEGESYAGVQRTYVVTPQREGEFVLPPLEIRFKYAAVPGQPPADGVVTMPPARLVARLPEGARTEEGVLPVARVTVGQSLDRPATGLKAGDTLTRTITSVIARAQPMMILPPAIEAPAGVRIYRKDPSLDTRVGVHGELNAGRRVDRVTYLFEKPGHYTLPAVEFPWFNAAANSREVASAPEITVDVEQAAAEAPAIAPEPPPPAPAPPKPSPWLALERRLPWILGAFALVWLAYRLWRALWPGYRDRRAARRYAHEHSEPAYFERFERACAAGDPLKAYDALARWAGSGGPVSIRDWCAILDHDGFTAEVELLERSLFRGAMNPAAWAGARMQAAAREARTTWLAREARMRRRRAALPPMNPGWSSR